MRTVLCVITACGGLIFSGCVAITDPATNVTQTSVRLNAHGRSDDSPTHFYFRYANQEADLPTAAAKRTPQRTVPAHVPQGGGNVAFGENVSGLSPGRLYFFEVCGGDAAVNPDLCGGRRKFVTQPTERQDWVLGTFFFGGPFGHIVEVQAASGPQGQNADGWLTDNLRDLGVVAEGRVTCLVVDGGRAAVGVVGQSANPPDGPPRPYSAVWTLRDDGTFHAAEQSPPDCAGASFDDQGAADSWNITIHNAD